MKPAVARRELDRLYETYNHRRYVHPDPLEFLYAYPNIEDRELVGFVAASIAYGRVAQILKSVSGILAVMGPTPVRFLMETPDPIIRRSFEGFRHRFATGYHLSGMLIGLKRIIGQFGSLYTCFLSGYRDADETVLPALNAFASTLRMRCQAPPEHLVALPERGSACKRLHLYLRWMVRKDAVDPGGWDGISPSRLIVPVDIHMHRFGLSHGLTARKQVDMSTAVEMTNAFRKIVPGDPVKYDFALTRMGIRGNAGLPVDEKGAMKGFKGPEGRGFE